MVEPARQRAVPSAHVGAQSDATYRLESGDSLETIAARFGIVDAQGYAELARRNPLLASGRAAPGTMVSLPPTAAESVVTTSPMKPATYLDTSWSKGFDRKVTGQNNFNPELASAALAWPDLDPLVLKSILAQESSFNAGATNVYGYAGIAQIGVSEARAAGLTTGSSRMRRGRSKAFVDRRRDERLQPKRAIPAAAIVLEQKARALQPSFDRYGAPAGDDYWRFVSAAYNGGEGTIRTAMKIAFGTSKPDAVAWDDLVHSKDGNIRHAPLYVACARVFRGMALTKFREISGYARDVVLRARQ